MAIASTNPAKDEKRAVCLTFEKRLHTFKSRGLMRSSIYFLSAN